MRVTVPEPISSSEWKRIPPVCVQIRTPNQVLIPAMQAHNAEFETLSRYTDTSVEQNDTVTVPLSQDPGSSLPIQTDASARTAWPLLYLPSCLFQSPDSYSKATGQQYCSQFRDEKAEAWGRMYFASSMSGARWDSVQSASLQACALRHPFAPNRWWRKG